MFFFLVHFLNDNDKNCGYFVKICRFEFIFVFNRANVLVSYRPPPLKNINIILVFALHTSE